MENLWRLLEFDMNGGGLKKRGGLLETLVQGRGVCQRGGLKESELNRVFKVLEHEWI